MDFNEGVLNAADVDEFVASLDHWDSAPTVTRFYAQWMAIRALAYNSHLDYAEQLLSRFTPFVVGLDSRQASRLLADLYATIASTRQDWQDAARWYGKVVEGTEGSLSTWFDLVAAWHLLATRCLGPEPADITGAELRDPWHCYHNERIDMLRWHGAVSTAIALQRIGCDDLAARFVDWAYANDPTELMAEGVSPGSHRSRRTPKHRCRLCRRPRHINRRGVRRGRPP